MHFGQIKSREEEASRTKLIISPKYLFGIILFGLVLMGNVDAATANSDAASPTLVTPTPKESLQASRWLGYWNLTTAEQANVVTSSGAGPFTYCSSQPPAAFSATEGALVFNPPSTYQYMGHVDMAPQVVAALTMGMRIKNFMYPQRALAILEAGPAFRSVESALSGNNSGTYFTTALSPGGDERFSGSPVGGDQNWHWVIVTVDYSTKAVKLFVDGSLYSSMTSAYAHSSVSVGSVFIHCWQNQWSLISHVFCYRGMMEESDIVSLSNGVVPDSQGMLLLPPVITSSATASAVMGEPFSFQIAATNNPTVFSAIGLPSGLNLNSVSGLISGTPVVAGSSTVAIGASNSSGSGSASLMLTVAAGTIPVITSPATAAATVGQSFNYQIVATSATSFSAISLPAGLTLDISSGRISGAPSEAGTTIATLSASGPGGTGTSQLTITVAGVVEVPAVSAVPVILPSQPTLGALGGGGGSGGCGLGSGLGLSVLALFALRQFLQIKGQILRRIRPRP